MILIAAVLFSLSGAWVHADEPGGLDEKLSIGVGYRPTLSRYTQNVDVNAQNQSDYSDFQGIHLSFYSNASIPLDDHISLNVDFNFQRRVIDILDAERFMNQFNTVLTGEYKVYESGENRIKVGPAFRVLTAAYVSADKAINPLIEISPGTTFYAGAIGRGEHAFSARNLGWVTLALEEPFSFIAAGKDLFKMKPGIRLDSMAGFRRYLSHDHEWYADFTVGVAFDSLQFDQKQPFAASNTSSRLDGSFGAGLGCRY